MRYMDRLETIDLSSNDISVVAEFRFLGVERLLPRLEHVCVADNPQEFARQVYVAKTAETKERRVLKVIEAIRNL